MTPNEAADLLRHGAMLAGYKNGKRMDEAIRMAVEALEENQKLRVIVDALADRLDRVPIYDPCDDLWSSHGWCEEHCKKNQTEPSKECWIKWAEVMASE